MKLNLTAEIEMAKKYAMVEFDATDVQAAIRSFEEDNEGHDPPFTLKLNDAEAEEVLKDLEEDIETEMSACGVALIKERLLIIQGIGKDKALVGL